MIVSWLRRYGTSLTRMMDHIMPTYISCWYDVHMKHDLACLEMVLCHNTLDLY